MIKTQFDLIPREESTTSRLAKQAKAEKSRIKLKKSIDTSIPIKYVKASPNKKYLSQRSQFDIVPGPENTISQLAKQAKAEQAMKKSNLLSLAQDLALTNPVIAVRVINDITKGQAPKKEEDERLAQAFDQAKTLQIQRAPVELLKQSLVEQQKQNVAQANASKEISAELAKVLPPQLKAEDIGKEIVKAFPPQLTASEIVNAFKTEFLPDIQKFLTGNVSAPSGTEPTLQSGTSQALPSGTSQALPSETSQNQQVLTQPYREDPEKSILAISRAIKNAVPGQKKEALSKRIEQERENLGLLPTGKNYTITEAITQLRTLGAKLPTGRPSWDFAKSAVDDIIREYTQPKITEIKGEGISHIRKKAKKGKGFMDAMQGLYGV